MKNCWLKRSRFQMALILILIIAIPFLLAMIVVYVMSGFVLSDSRKCGDLCDILEGQMHPGYIVIHTNITNRTKRFYDIPESENKPIAALLEKLYDDDNQEYIFKCAAAVISKRWAVASAECAKSGVSDIRISSEFWSMDGVLKNIEEVLFSDKYSKLALVGFEEVEVGGVSFGQVGGNRKVRSFTWESTPGVPLLERKKYQRLRSFAIKPDQSKSAITCIEKKASCYFTQSRESCGKKINAPMIDENQLLIGFHLQTLCPKNETFAIISFIDIHVYKDWLCKIIQ